MSYKVSVIIPVYNVEFSIENCFLSLMNQTIGFENLEIIFVDDCSTDRSVEIIKKYQEEYENVKLFSCEENSGVAGKPRNIGLKHVTTKYVMFLDPDDTFYIDACETLFNKIEETDVDLVSGIHTKKNKTQEKEETYPGLILNTFTNPRHSWKDRKTELNKFLEEYPDEIHLKTIDDMPSILGNFGLSSKIFKIETIKKYNITFPEYIAGEDSTFLLKYLLHSVGIIFINKPIYSYTTFRNDEDNKSVSFQVDIDKNLGRLKAYKIMLNASKESNKIKEFVQYILINKLIYFLNSFVIKPKIHKKDMKTIFDYGNELFKEVLNADVTLSEEHEELFEYIVTKKYDDAIELCESLRKESKTRNETPYIDDINVAVILDPFTYNSYNNEFNMIPIEPENWKEIFENNIIDLLFVESAFYGVGDGNIIDGIAIENDYKPWGGKLGINLEHGWDSRSILFEILDYCKKNNIPTIFWNKEDPTSFDAPLYNFIDTAIKFDYIFTTDEDTIIRYNARGHKNVYPLLFASQIKLFNPIEKNERSTDIIFAGSWYNQFPDRCEVMEDLFDKIIKSKNSLKIYDRASDLNQKKRMFPEKYKEYVNPKVSFDKIPAVYKESKYALNINTVTNSNTMFARRVFELMSSNTLVFSNYSEGIYKLFKNNVIYLDKIDSLDISNYDIEKICEENMYNILTNHTYHERFKYILNTIGFKYKENTKKVYIIYNTKSNEDIDKIITDFNSINYVYKECIIISSDNNINVKSEDNTKITVINNIKSLNLTIRTHQDYFVIRNTSTKFDEDFIKKAILHYQYIDKTCGIKKNNKKYTMNISSEYENVLFNSSQLNNVLNMILKNKKEELNIYNI